MKQKKTWKRVAPGIYRHKSGTLYERPRLGDVPTYRSLETDDLESAKKELHRRKAAADAQAVKDSSALNTILVGQVIDRYALDGHRDRQRHERPPLTKKAEADNCTKLLGFWKKIPVDKVSIGAFDRYHSYRQKQITRGVGDRSVDLELCTLNNAFLWACRCDLVSSNPLAVHRPRYTSARHVKHCRKFMPANADELHKLARLLFARPHAVVLGWQALVEAVTGLRTCEALALRTDAAPHEPGWITPDGKSLCVWRSKSQDGVNPFVPVNEGLRQTLDALFRWKQENYPDSPWFFPSPRKVGKVVDKSALAHALVRIRKELGRKITSHGFRAWYVTVRRSHGIMDSQIAWEIGHTTGGATLIEVYGGVPPHWLTGDGPKLSWLPNGAPGWSPLKPETNIIQLKWALPANFVGSNASIARN